jgi:ribosome assembly protein YihI (activator of Der GTPase)
VKFKGRNSLSGISVTAKMQQLDNHGVKTVSDPRLGSPPPVPPLKLYSPRWVPEVLTAKSVPKV